MVSAESKISGLAMKKIFSGYIFSVMTLLFTLLPYDTSSYAFADNQSVVRCSIINLIATPDAYAGKKIRVIGYAVFEFEGQVIFLSENDAKAHIGMNGIWLNLDDTLIPKLDVSKLANRYVIVEGVFSAVDKGHLGMFSGSIGKIDRLDLWK